MSNKNEVFEYLIDQLRQQVTNNPYKQQCEDLEHEVQSLKNQLRDASAQIKELHKALATATGDVEAYKLIREQEQSGCRKEDTQECDHNWIIAPGLFIAEGHKDNVPGSRFCCECGAREWDDPGYEPKAYTQKCKHEWEYYYPNGEEHRRCAKCGVITEQSGCRKENTQECEHDWVLDEKGDYFVCAKCGKQEAELIDCQHTNTVGLRKGFAPGFTKKCLDCGAKLK